MIGRVVHLSLSLLLFFLFFVSTCLQFVPPYRYCFQSEGHMEKEWIWTLHLRDIERLHKHGCWVVGRCTCCNCLFVKACPPIRLLLTVVILLLFRVYLPSYPTPAHLHDPCPATPPRPSYPTPARPSLSVNLPFYQTTCQPGGSSWCLPVPVVAVFLLFDKKFCYCCCSFFAQVLISKVPLRYRF